MTQRTISKLQRRKSSSADIIATGCLTKINPAALDGDYEVLPPEELGALDQRLNARVPFTDVPDANFVRDVHNLSSLPIAWQFRESFQWTLSAFVRAAQVLKRRFSYSDRYRNMYLIKVSQGCASKCAYCVIRKAGGPLRSKAPEDIVEELERGVRQGYRDFSLVQHDLGCYGFDIGTNIVALLEALFKVEGDFQIELPDFNPRWLMKYYDDLLPLLSRYAHKVSCLVAPIQSGSNHILEAMNRFYRAEEVVACIRGLKQCVPGLPIETHVMVGFPGETEADFEATKDMIRELGMAKVILYDYEDAPGAISSTMPNKVPRQEIIRRKRILERMLKHGVYKTSPKQFSQKPVYADSRQR